MILRFARVLAIEAAATVMRSIRFDSIRPGFERGGNLIRSAGLHSRMRKRRARGLRFRADEGEKRLGATCPALTFIEPRAYYRNLPSGDRTANQYKKLGLLVESERNPTVIKERDMKKWASILLATFALASSAAYAQFNSTMTGAGLESAVKSQMAAGRTAADIARAALAAGVDAGALTTALLVSGVSPDAAIQAVIRAGGNVNAVVTAAINAGVAPDTVERAAVAAGAPPGQVHGAVVSATALALRGQGLATGLGVSAAAGGGGSASAQ